MHIAPQLQLTVTMEAGVKKQDFFSGIHANQPTLKASVRDLPG